jgi:hypothetical protein
MAGGFILSFTAICFRSCFVPKCGFMEKQSYLDSQVSIWTSKVRGMTVEAQLATTD